MIVIPTFFAIYFYIRWQRMWVENVHLKTREKEQAEAYREKLALVLENRERLSEAFELLAKRALQDNNVSFLQLAKEALSAFQEKAKQDLEKRQASIEHALKPVQESLIQLDKGMQAIEKERKGEQESLKERLRLMVQAERELRLETASLVKALRRPDVRGRWGEMQLRRVVELAGMVNHCDFYEQQQQIGDEGQSRPDVIIRLPGGKQVIVDAKTPCDAYLEAIEAEDHTLKEEKMRGHAKQLKQHIVTLGKKAYWQRFQPTPEFVVLFIPSDNFFNSALEYDPTLIEMGVKEGVVIATPTTLIGLLKAIAYGWKQEILSQHTKEVSHLGHELYKRLIDMGEHWHKMGRSLANSVEAYNKAVGSLESRVLVSARKFKEMGAAPKSVDLRLLESIDQIPRRIQVEEMPPS